MAIDYFAVPARSVLKPIDLVDAFNTLSYFCFSLVKSDIVSEALRPAQHRHFSSTGIIPIIETYTTTIWDLLRKEGSRFEGVSTPLHDLVHPVLYQASVRALFGCSFPVVEFYEPFNDFDKSFHLSLAGVPRVFLRKHVRGLAAMDELLEKYFDGPHEDASGSVLENEQVMRDQGHVCFHLTTGDLVFPLKSDPRIRKPSRRSLFVPFSLYWKTHRTRRIG